MRLAALEPLGFRNLAAARVELGPGIVVLHGPNGSGKTNLLEAVYFGLTNRSFRTGNDRDLIAFGEPAARVELELEGPPGSPGPGSVPSGGVDRVGGAERSVLLSALERGGERRHRIDGRKLDASTERPLVSVFHPDRLQLVKGPAAHRRAHLDRLVGALWPARADLRSRFGRTLAQRNALVSRINAGHAPAGSLPSWDERLADEAEPLIASRAEAVDSLSGPFGELAAGLGLEDAGIAYRPRHAGDRGELTEELAARRAVDLGRAYTSYGPQLDEVQFQLGGVALRRFGSQGQQRAALLALLFAERSALIDAGRSAPIMLLDDVMSELDPERRALLVDSLAGAGQALLTATESAHVPQAPGVDIVSVAVSAGAALRPAPEPGTRARPNEVEAA